MALERALWIAERLLVEKAVLARAALISIAVPSATALALVVLILANLFASSPWSDFITAAVYFTSLFVLFTRMLSAREMLEASILKSSRFCRIFMLAYFK